MPQPWGIMLHKIHTFGCKRRSLWHVDGVAIFIFFGIGEISPKSEIKIKKIKNEMIMED
jgi:hypothetical protein